MSGVVHDDSIVFSLGNHENDDKNSLQGQQSISSIASTPFAQSKDPTENASHALKALSLNSDLRPVSDKMVDPNGSEPVNVIGKSSESNFNNGEFSLHSSFSAETRLLKDRRKTVMVNTFNLSTKTDHNSSSFQLYHDTITAKSNQL